MKKIFPLAILLLTLPSLSFSADVYKSNFYDFGYNVVLHIPTDMEARFHMTLISLNNSNNYMVAMGRNNIVSFIFFYHSDNRKKDFSIFSTDKGVAWKLSFKENEPIPEEVSSLPSIIQRMYLETLQRRAFHEKQ